LVQKKDFTLIFTTGESYEEFKNGRYCSDVDNSIRRIPEFGICSILPESREDIVQQPTKFVEIRETFVSISVQATYSNRKKPTRTATRSGHRNDQCAGGAFGADENHRPRGARPSRRGSCAAGVVGDVARIAEASWDSDNPRVFPSLGGTGRFLMRKGDGEPGWMTIWRGVEKLLLAVRGYEAMRDKCG